MVDILEEKIYRCFPEAFTLLLKDQTTQKNILWATHDYENKGNGYQFNDEITIERITGQNGCIIKPRTLKEKSEQTIRTKMKAEMFTPSWVCNIQNNVTDESWFGRKGVFNTEDIENKSWRTNHNPIEFTGDKTWVDYVSARRIEITCGEAPYLVSRYDTTTGELLPLKDRIGLLDRKLRVVGENTSSQEEWMKYAQIAYKTIYGYEWQGDSLLLARESLLMTFCDYFMDKYHESPNAKVLSDIAYIISWNLWQMDGLKCVVPGTCHDIMVQSTSLFDNDYIVTPCEGCKTNNIHKHNGVYCLIKNWDDHNSETDKSGVSIKFVDLLK